MQQSNQTGINDIANALEVNYKGEGYKNMVNTQSAYNRR
jgi:hypothetical protein